MPTMWSLFLNVPYRVVSMSSRKRTLLSHPVPNFLCNRDIGRWGMSRNRDFSQTLIPYLRLYQWRNSPDVVRYAGGPCHNIAHRLKRRRMQDSSHTSRSTHSESVVVLFTSESSSQSLTSAMSMYTNSPSVASSVSTKTQTIRKSRKNTVLYINRSNAERNCRQKKLHSWNPWCSKR